MQGHKSGIGSFREAIDVGQGSDSNTAEMNQQSSLNSLIPPVESRWSSYASSGETCVNASNNEVQNFAGTSEPTGSALRNQANEEGTKIEHGRSSSHGAHHTVGLMTEEILFPGRAIISLGGNQVNGPSFSQGSSSNHIRQHVNLNAGYVGNSGNGEQGIGASLGPNLYLSSRLETDHTSIATSPDILGTSAGSSGCIAGEDDGNSGSLGNWSLSCKRKALEGTSGQSCSGGSSSSFLQAENCVWHNGPARFNPSSSLRLSAPSYSSPNGSSREQQNPRTGISAGVVASEAFPSSSATGSRESSLRQAGSETNIGSQHESIPFNLASAGSSRRYSLRTGRHGEPSDLRSTAAAGSNSGASQSQSHSMHIPGFSGNVHTFPWNGASNSRAGSMSNSFSFGERGTEIQEDASLRSLPRTNGEHPMFVSATEMRNTAQDPTSSTSLGIPASTRIASSSSSPPLPPPAWIPHHNSSPAQNRQRTLEFAPWSLFPSIETQPGGRSGPLDPLPPGPSSSRNTIMSSGRNNPNRQPPFHRSAFFMDRQGEDALSISNSLRVLSADIEGRRRLISEQIRQVLHAMRRGENLQIEDYMLLDPFTYHGMAEMHDRHRDMRLDVDNMSYEELLALEERIGDVSTGLSEETILKLMKQQKHESTAVESALDSEPCCICQEEYVDGDNVGVLNCGHDFHTDCVKQWLMQKNLCPICKTTGLQS